MSEKQDRQGARTPADLERKYQFGKRFAEIMGVALDAQNTITRVESELRGEIVDQYTKIMRDTEKIILEAGKKYVETSDYEEYQQTVSSQFIVMAEEISANLKSTTELISDLEDKHDEVKEYCESNISATAKQVALNMESTTDSFTEVNTAIENAQGDIEDQQKYTEELKEHFESEISATARDLNIKFESSTELITNVNGDVQEISEDLKKHFNFSANGLTIKAGESEMKLRIDNDLIAFYKGDIDESDLAKNRFGWWDGVNFYTGNIMIEVNERAQLGNFAFVPRSNGSLDFLKVGG